MRKQRKYRRYRSSGKRRYISLFLLLAVLLCAELAAAWHMEKTTKNAAEPTAEISEQSDGADVRTPEPTGETAGQPQEQTDSGQTQTNTAAPSEEKTADPETPAQDGTSASAVQDAPVAQTSSGQYYIKVNYSANVVTVYDRDQQGRYSVPSRAMLCSTGADTPRSGRYNLYGTGKWQWLGLYDGVYGQYCTQITGDILFHSVPYLERGNKASLEYWEYDKLGTSCSMGCVRLQAGDALWIYEHHDVIEAVEFYGAADDPGPLGRPAAPQISDNESCRSWDPTDPDAGNPWLAAQ